MVKDGWAALERGLSGISVVGRYAVSGPECFREGAVHLDGETLKAEAFYFIPGSKVRAVVPFIITAGECLCDDEEPLMNKLYAYMWGSAYADAARLYMENMLKEEVVPPGMGRVLSPPFGPGFYGMDNRKSSSISKILGSREIGISVNDAGVMFPLKSCSGLYLITEEETGLPGDECLYCDANRGGCPQCFIHKIP